MTISDTAQQSGSLAPQQELEQSIEQVLQLAVNLHRSGQFDDAVEMYKAILKVEPHHPDANHNLGILEVQAQKASAALPYLEAALGAEPDRAQFWLSYIDALIQAGQIETARQVLEMGKQHGLEGDEVAILAERVRVEWVKDEESKHPQADEADKKPNQVKRSKPAGSDKRRKSGKNAATPNAKEAEEVMTLLMQQRIGEMESLTRSMTLRYPRYGFGWKALGVALIMQSRYDEALPCMQKAAVLLPNDAQVHSNLGGCLNGQSRFAESEVVLRRAITINPNYAEAHSNLGTALLCLSRTEEAAVHLRRALEIKPDLHTAHNSLLFCLSELDGIDPGTLFAEHCRFSDQFERPLQPHWRDHNLVRDPDRPLQIGFVSGDLYYHAVANFFEPVLRHLAEKEILSLHAYSNYGNEDNVTKRLRGYFRHWNSIVGLNDDALAEKIRSDRIDILIDLSGHTGRNRLLTFARKPAPIQASWIGYPGTTGLQAMDYYLTDRHLLPLGEFDHLFTEKLAYLPANAPFLPSSEAPPVNVLPAQSNGFVTFGSFNRPSRISRKVVAAWSQILRALPSARMLLGAMAEESNKDTLIDWFSQEGVDLGGLSFYPRSSMQNYLTLHHQVDFCLDTFPYNGGTTAMHAMWMGVPTLTLAGHTVASRTGACALAHFGIDDFVATDEADYVQKALLIASNISYLADLRASARKRIEQSAIGRPQAIADGLEHALRTMWRRWCAGQPAIVLDTLTDQ